MLKVEKREKEIVVCYEINSIQTEVPHSISENSLVNKPMISSAIPIELFLDGNFKLSGSGITSNQKTNEKQTIEINRVAIQNNTIGNIQDCLFYLGKMNVWENLNVFSG